jgi:mannan endo-1,4-beta-mannosidase
MMHKPVSMVEFGAPFANCRSRRCSFYGFPRAAMANVRSHGAIPVLAWSSQSIPSRLDEPDFRLRVVASGRYDSFIRDFALAARNWGHPFFLRFDWEMNGDWFPWGERANRNRRGDFVAAWRHVHDIFSSVGASNVAWSWCPNVDPRHYWRNLSELYPGDAYVDWTCLDGYNWGTTGPRSEGAKRGGWQSFDQVYSSTYRLFVQKLAPSKPIMLGEVGSSGHGGSKAAWIAHMLYRLPRAYPQIHAVLWAQSPYNNWDFPILPHSSAARAFALGIQSPAYVQAPALPFGG